MFSTSMVKQPSIKNCSCRFFNVILEYFVLSYMAATPSTGAITACFFLLVEALLALALLDAPELAFFSPPLVMHADGSSTQSAATLSTIHLNSMSWYSCEFFTQKFELCVLRRCLLLCT